MTIQFRPRLLAVALGVLLPLGCGSGGSTGTPGSGGSGGSTTGTGGSTTGTGGSTTGTAGSGTSGAVVRSKEGPACR